MMLFLCLDRLVKRAGKVSSGAGLRMSKLGLLPMAVNAKNSLFDTDGQFWLVRQQFVADGVGEVLG